MTQHDYDLEHHAYEMEARRRLRALADIGDRLHQAEYDEREQRIEVWLSRRIDRLDKHFIGV